MPKNISGGLAALEAYLNERRQPGYVGGRPSGNLLINEYAANIPYSAEQEREAESMDYLDDITRASTAQEHARLGREQRAREAGFKDVADALGYERGMEQLKAMIPLQVASMNAQGQMAARQAAQQRFQQAEAGKAQRAQQAQEAVNERQFRGQQEGRAKAIESGKGGVGTSVLRDFFGWLPGVDSNQDIRGREAAKVRGQQYQPRITPEAAMRQAAQIAVQKYSGADPMEMLQLMGEDEMTPEEQIQFGNLVAEIRGY